MDLGHSGTKEGQWAGSVGEGMRQNRGVPQAYWGQKVHQLMESDIKTSSSEESGKMSVLH